MWGIVLRARQVVEGESAREVEPEAVGCAHTMRNYGVTNDDAAISDGLREFRAMDGKGLETGIAMRSADFTAGSGARSVHSPLV